MGILLESGEGLFLTLRFARDCRPFFEGRAPAGPPMGILDERCEGFFDQLAETIVKYEQSVLPD